VIPAIASEFVPAYEVHAKDIEFYQGRITPKVFFFCVPPASKNRMPE